MIDQNYPRLTFSRFGDLPESDVRCEGCGYCLRTQPKEGRCPECGTTVAESAIRVADRLAGVVATTGQGDARRTSDLRAGPWLMLAAWGCSLVILLLPDLKSMDTPRICLWVAGFGLGTTGLLVATRPSRHGGEPLDVRLTRLLVRIATVIAIPFVLVPLHLMQGFRRPTGWLDTYFNLAFYCSIWASALLFLYAGQIAWRAGRRVTAVEAFAVFVLASIVWTLVSMETGIEVLMGVGGRVSEIINALPISGVLLTATLASDLVNMPGGFAADLRRGVILLASCWSLLVLVHLALMPGRRMDAADDVERTMGDQ